MREKAETIAMQLWDFMKTSPSMKAFSEKKSELASANGFEYSLLHDEEDADFIMRLDQNGESYRLYLQWEHAEDPCPIKVQKLFTIIQQQPEEE